MVNDPEGSLRATETSPSDRRSSASGSQSRRYAETGFTVSEPFLSFLDHFGLTICGLPITGVFIENGVRTQYFQNVALEEHLPGQIRLKPLGEVVLEAKMREAREKHSAEVPQPLVHDVVATLPRHETQSYPTRTLSDVRHIVIHHTGAPGTVDVSAIAREHVEANGWPGIGYHYVIDVAGRIFRTQDLTTSSHHARQFNPVSIGIALMGDLTSQMPTQEQIDSCADLLTKLLFDLGLPLDAVRGHREMVPTPCPGETFLPVWKPRLIEAVNRRLSAALGMGMDLEPESSPADAGTEQSEPEEPGREVAEDRASAVRGAEELEPVSEVVDSDVAEPTSTAPDEAEPPESWLRFKRSVEAEDVSDSGSDGPEAPAGQPDAAATEHDAEAAQPDAAASKLDVQASETDADEAEPTLQAAESGLAEDDASAEPAQD